ncbi:MAG: hypothetical protein A2066_15785 [Bacteroidetes bacterium GWB2_41_8]|nr:MAG: hypothetical protein A2066_15785 [Bacteroidetes bacterium GWB2_41_8]
MALNKGKHLVEEIDGVRCTVVEKGITHERAQFLKTLLELNGLEVKTAVEADPATMKLGVTDILFNPVIDVYERRLKSPSGKKVTPAYWLQKSENESEAEVNYWNKG